MGEREREREREREAWIKKEWHLERTFPIYISYFNK